MTYSRIILRTSTVVESIEFVLYLRVLYYVVLVLVLVQVLKHRCTAVFRA